MPRHSAGCRNCVRRRIRCDEVKPYCKNCQKASLDCGGARSELLFVHQATGSRKKTPRKSSRATSHPNRPATTSPKICCASRPDPSPEDVRQLYTPISWSVSRDDEHAYLCFLSNYFQEVRIFRRQSRAHEDWVTICAASPSQYPLACLALRSLAAGFYGRRHRQEHIISKAAGLYSEVLKALHETLEHQPEMFLFDVLAAITALHHYEKLMLTSQKGWIHHAGGISRIIELTGPEYFRCYPNKTILDNNRFVIILDAYWNRKRTFLERDEWKMPESDMEDRDALSLELQDLNARLPGLAEDVQSFVFDTKSRAGQFQDISEDADVLLRDLEEWLLKWKARFPQAPIERPPCDLDSDIFDDEEGPIFESLLQYPCLQAAIGFNVYRAIKIVTLQWKYKLQHPHWNPGTKRETTLDVGSMKQLALELCRSLGDHFNTGGRQVSGIFFLLFNASVAYRALPFPSREARWISRIFQKVADRTGMELARNMTQTLPLNFRTTYVVNTDALLAGAK